MSNVSQRRWRHAHRKEVAASTRRRRAEQLEAYKAREAERRSGDGREWRNLQERAARARNPELVRATNAVSRWRKNLRQAVAREDMPREQHCREQVAKWEAHRERHRTRADHRFTA